MKCPEQYKIVQHNMRRPLIDSEDRVCGEYHLLAETQKFSECYKENCVAWDNEKKICRKCVE